MYSDIPVVSVMACNLKVVVHIMVIVQQVTVVVVLHGKIKSYDSSSPSISDGSFRQMRMLGELFKQM